MRSLINFLLKFNNLIIFIILEGVSLFLLVNGNNYHNTRFITGLRGLTTGIDSKISNARSYFHLREINQELAEENIDLKNRLDHYARKEDSVFFGVSDSVFKQQYQHTSAVVIENSINKQKNFFTINKGKRQGIRIDMAVTSKDGVAGMIVGVSDNFSVAMSLLNLDFKLSSRMKSNGYFGSLVWNGRDPHEAALNDIPQHVAVSIGDTVETTGYSAIFPEGLKVGVVSDYQKPGGDFYKITVRLFTDFRKLHFVDVIGNLKKTELLELQNQYQ
jgi:rod shape-determining protein MreC